MTDEKSKPRPSPFCLRLTPDERLHLERNAQSLGLSLAAFLKWRGLSPTSVAPKSRHRHPVKDHQALTQVMAWFGASRLPQNLNQLAKAVNTGALPVTPDTEAALRDLCREISAVCALIRKALGFTDDVA